MPVPPPHPCQNEVGRFSCGKDNTLALWRTGIQKMSQYTGLPHAQLHLCLQVQDGDYSELRRKELKEANWPAYPPHFPANETIPVAYDGTTTEKTDFFFTGDYRKVLEPDSWCPCS